MSGVFPISNTPLPLADESSVQWTAERKAPIQNLRKTNHFPSDSQAVNVLDKLILASKNVVAERIAVSALLDLSASGTQKEENRANKAPGTGSSQQDGSLSYEKFFKQQATSYQDLHWIKESLTPITNSHLVSLDSSFSIPQSLTLLQPESFEQRRDALSQEWGSRELQRSRNSTSNGKPRLPYTVIKAVDIQALFNAIQPLIKETETIDNLRAAEKRGCAIRLEHLMQEVGKIRDVPHHPDAPNNARQYFQAILETFHELRVYIDEGGLTENVGKKLLIDGVPYSKEKVESLNTSFKKKLGPTTNKQEGPDKQLGRVIFDHSPNGNRPTDEQAVSIKRKRLR